MRNRSTLRRDRGFTLVELMVVITIATILTVIAVPAYNSQVRKSRRTEAKTALLDLAGREERYLSANGAYTVDGKLLGYPQTAWPQTTASGYYNITVSNVNPGTAGTTTTAGTAPTFTITAVPVSTSAQAKDTGCASFVIDQTGAQTSSPNTTGCW